MIEYPSGETQKPYLDLVRLTLLPAEACALPSEGFVLFREAMTLPPEANALPGEAPGRLRFRLRDILGFVECVLG